MLKEDALEGVEAMKISLHSLMKILIFLYPEEEFVTTTIDGLKYHILIAIDSSKDKDNEGSVVYDLSDGMAFGFSDSWLEAIEYVKASVQEVWFHNMEQDLIFPSEGEMDTGAAADPPSSFAGIEVDDEILD